MNRSELSLHKSKAQKEIGYAKIIEYLDKRNIVDACRNICHYADDEDMRKIAKIFESKLKGKGRYQTRN